MGEDTNIILSTDPMLKCISVLYIYSIPYSTKFSRDKFSRIGLLQIFVEINFADQGFPLAMPSLGSRLHYFTHSCSIAMLGSRFALLIELRLGSSWFIRLSSSTTHFKPETPPHKALTNATSAVEETYDAWQPPKIWKRSL